MRRLILLCVSVLPLITFVADEASAQRRFRGGGFHGGNFGGGGFRPAGIRPDGFRGVRPRPGRSDFIPGRTRWQVGPDRWRPGWGPRPYYPRRWVGPGYYPGYWGGGWGWGGAGLATGIAIGAAAASPYPAYGAPVSSSLGGSCATPARVCILTNPAPIGTGCSCRVPGGRARGSVVGP